MTPLVTYALDGGIATITMDDGKVNAWSIDMLHELHAAFDQAERDGAIVIATGREGRFCGGFDLQVFSAGDPARLLEMLRLGATLSARVLAFPRPVVVACTGHAVAAGTFLPLAADVRIGAEGPFTIGLNEVKIGLTVPWFAIELARVRLTNRDFDRAVVAAELYDPAGAVAAGFLDRIVAPGELREESLRAAGALAELNAEAHAATKLRVRAGAIEAMRAAIESELTPP